MVKCAIRTFSVYLLVFVAVLHIGSSTCRAVDADPFEQPTEEFYSQIDHMTDHAWALARKDPDSAMYYAEKAARLSLKHGTYAKGLINAKTLLGILNKDRGYYEISVGHYLEAMQLAETEGDSLRVSGCLNNLGVVAQKQRNFTKALSYFHRSLNIEKELGTDPVQRSIRLYNIGEVYEKLDSLDEAYAYYYNSLLIEEDLGNKDGIFYARLGIGKVDSRNGNYVKAGENLAIALVLGEEMEDNPGICETRIALGENFFRKKELQKAKEEFQKALDKATSFQYPSLRMESFDGLSRVARALGQFEESLSYLEQYYALREELNSSEVNSRIGELQAQYDLEKKEREIAMLEREDRLKEQEIGYERRLRNYLIFAVGFILVLTLISLAIGRGVFSRS